MTARAPRVSLVICTFNRLALLQEAVASCLADATRRDMPFEIIIADNSPMGHAEALATSFAEAGAPVCRVSASPPNISVARNAGLRAARADLVAFVDDDLVVEPGWLDYLVDTLEQTGADVAVGPVRPRFVGGTAPDWDPEGSRFTRSLDQPSGARISAGYRDKPKCFAISTASSLWRATNCFADPEPFDPGFGASGGEDLELFLRLERRQRRFAWCAEAGVWESIPPSRTKLRYQALRAYSGGQVFVAAEVRNAADPTREAMRHMLRGGVQLLAGSPFLVSASVMWLLRRRSSRQDLARRLLDMAAAAGKLFWWRKLALYHMEKPSGPAAQGIPDGRSA